MLSAENITVKRGARAILNQVYFDLHCGEVTAVVGPNGSGKSTILKALTGELPLARGQVTINGRPLQDRIRHPRDIARWRAVLPQQSNLSFNFPVIDIVLMGRSPHPGGGETVRDIDICESALEQVECLNLRDRMYQHLSGGEKQRVHLARVIAQLHDAMEARQPALVFLDEPTANLDLKHQYQILELAREFSRKNVAVFVVLHDLQQARAYSDRVLMLKAGRVAASGKTRETLTAQRIERVFDIPVEWLEHSNQAFLKINPNT